MSEPSAYELERLANMAANQRQLEAMGLVEAADACREPSPPKKQPKKRKKAQPKRELPKRHSTRANGGSENLLALDAEISKEEREKRAAQLEAHLLSLDEPPPPPRHAGLPLKDGDTAASYDDAMATSKQEFTLIACKHGLAHCDFSSAAPKRA